MSEAPNPLAPFATAGGTAPTWMAASVEVWADMRAGPLGKPDVQATLAWLHGLRDKGQAKPLGPGYWQVGVKR